DALRRGTGGPVHVEQPHDPHPAARALVSAADLIGIPVYDSPNGEMMEGPGGAAIADLRIREGKRESVFRSYTYPMITKPNLTVITNALVTRLLVERKKVIGVEVMLHGVRRQFRA